LRLRKKLGILIKKKEGMHKYEHAKHIETKLLMV